MGLWVSYGVTENRGFVVRVQVKHAMGTVMHLACVW